MYDEDSAVGKLDGYVISVAGAGKLIGEQRLVRIEQVGRQSASATIVGEANWRHPGRERPEAGEPTRTRRSHAAAGARGAVAGGARPKQEAARRAGLAPGRGR